MGPTDPWKRVIDWIWFLPVRLAFWLIWLVARSGNRTAFDVHRTMWFGGLAVRPLTEEQKEEERRVAAIMKRRRQMR